jgi:ribulose-5-phosphate 4-epimerase/fuculose-1-phosphate aldolase
MTNQVLSAPAVRAEAAAAWRILGRLGLVDTVFNHMSVPVHDADGKKVGFYVNPHHRLATEISASDMVAISLATGSAVGNEPVNADGLILHHAIQRSFTGPFTAIHVHSKAACALSCTTLDIRATTQLSCEFAGQIDRIPYTGLLRAGDSCVTRIIDTLAQGRIALLNNHGVVVGGASTAEAVYVAYYFEEAAREALLLGALDPGVICTINDELAREVRGRLVCDRHKVATYFFEALKRQFGGGNE